MTVLDNMVIDDIRRQVASQLSERAAKERTAGARNFHVDDQMAMAGSLIANELHAMAARRLNRGEEALDSDAEERISNAVMQRLFKLGRLQPLLDDEQIMNIDANSCDEVFVEYADGSVRSVDPIANSDEEMIEMIREVGRRHGMSEREFNQTSPELDLQLPDGSRLHASAWVSTRPSLSIRRHRFMKLDLHDLVGLGTIDHGLAAFLDAAVKAKKQLIITGATGAGKTTMLRALASSIPPEERIVTIESERELGLHNDKEQHPNCVALECRPPNVEGVGEITASHLVRSALRMNPSRVIVGEVRGREVVDMLNVMSQGNEGSMCTLHADSSGTVFNKIGLYAMLAQPGMTMEVANELAAAAIDLVIWIEKSSRGRFVGSIRQVVGADGRQVVTNELYRPGPDGRAVPAMPIPMALLDELADNGYDPSLHERIGGWWT